MTQDPMISVAELAARLAAPDLRLLDATWRLPGDPRDPRAEHLEKRIPGAVFFDIDEIADQASPYPHMLPSPELFASHLRRLGVGDGAAIVVYDAVGVFSAARVWWSLRVMGAPDVRVLDGGLPAWEAAGLPLEEGPAPPPGERHFTVRMRQDLVRSLLQMREAVAEARAHILDARPAGRFSGRDPEPRPGLRPGHMPGAQSLPHTRLLGDDGRLRSRAELEQIFAGFALERRRPIIATCGSGVSAAVIALALFRLGRDDVALYDGAWAEWGALGDTPVVSPDG